MHKEPTNTIGDRLYKLRKKKGLSSKDVATALGFASHKSIIDIEFGRKNVSNAEMQKLAELYEVSLEKISINPSQSLNFKALFRAELGLQAETLENTITELYPKIELYFNLIDEVYPNTLLKQSYEYWMKNNYICPSNKSEAVTQGKLLANQLRKGLCLGESPITNMLLVCEMLNIVTLFIDFKNDDISGLYCDYYEVPLILINSANSSVRKRFSIAHEICHFLVDNAYLSKVPELTEEFEPFTEKNNRNYREVRANAFAASFLMPEEGLNFFLKNFLGKTNKSITIYDVIHVAHNYGVSFDTACYRLLNLDLMSDAAYEKMKPLKSKVSTIKEKLYGNTPTVFENFTDSDKNFISRLKNVCINAYQQGKLSIGKLCEIFDYAVLDQKQLLKDLEIRTPKVVPLKRPNPLL